MYYGCKSGASAGACFARISDERRQLTEGGRAGKTVSKIRETAVDSIGEIGENIHSLWMAQSDKVPEVGEERW